MMFQGSIDIEGPETEGYFLCPNHGPQKREFPQHLLASVTLLSAEPDVTQSIMESFRCQHCGQIFAASDIKQQQGFLEMKVQCPNGHKDTRFIPDVFDEEYLTKVLQRLVHCDKCGLPGHIAEVEEKRDLARVHTVCPIHGLDKKDIPPQNLEMLKQAVAEIPEDAIVNAMLIASDCTVPLAIREIEQSKLGYRFKCICPGKGHTTERVIPITWSDPVKKRITSAVLSCNECGLLTNVLDIRKGKKAVKLKVVCPIHGVMSRVLSPEVYGYFAEMEPTIDRVPSVVRSMSCKRCSMPLIVRDVEKKQDLIEWGVECRNGHRDKRFFTPDLDNETLTKLYKQLYQCPECYDQLDLVYIEPHDRESRVVLLCPLHGKNVLDIPNEHGPAMQTAYDELQADKLKPPVEVAEPEKVEELDVQPELPSSTEGAVQVLRGCEIAGGKFDYKVKVKNDSGYVVTNVTVSIVAYPQDCMEVAGETVKTISRIEVGGFRSPQFTFYPTKDCVQGKVVATVSYIDFKDQLHTLQVEPFMIRSVCDLLKPSRKSSQEFDILLTDLTKTQQEQTLDWNAQVLFTKAEKLLPARNFHVVDTEEKLLGGQFIGTIRGYAEGKYTAKKVAVIFMIAGAETGRQSIVKVEAMGEDIAMLPTTIDELADSIDSWICLRCGAPLEEEQVDEIHKRLPIRCRYCAHTLTLGLYLQ
jgi:DNA-directed RNA polymerase subunit RPC12/RpoP